MNTSDRFDRRSAIKWTAGGALGLLTASSAFAQTDELIDLLGDQLDKIKLPGKPLNLVRTVAAILELEKEADRKALPLSSFAPAKPVPLAPTETTLYEAAVPRLVALIDRSALTDAPMAERAGEILADVHAQERVVPDALKPAPLRTSRAKSYAALKAEYASLFENASVRPENADAIDWHRKVLLGSKTRYEPLATETKVPWYFIGLVHGLEASYNFRAHLHNGDFPLRLRTRQVPAGRPLKWLPPDDWESSARDALRLLGFTNQPDWSLERTLYRLEAYNGFGYRNVGVPTPYLWSYSNHYEKGKFVADGRWNANARSKQPGAATIMKALAASGDVNFG